MGAPNKSWVSVKAPASKPVERVSRVCTYFTDYISTWNIKGVTINESPCISRFLLLTEIRLYFEYVKICFAFV